MISGLRGRRAFELVRRHGERGRAPAIEVVRCAAPEPSSTRFVGFAVNRDLGSAVQRNRIRRRVRAILSDLDRRDDPCFPAGSYLFRLRPGLCETGSRELESRVVECLVSTRARRSS